MTRGSTLRADLLTSESHLYKYDYAVENQYLFKQGQILCATKSTKLCGSVDVPKGSASYSRKCFTPRVAWFSKICAMAGVFNLESSG